MISPAAGASRRAVAMWDFSWLTRRADPEAEYADWDFVLDGLRDRGYDCVRIDAFPHLVAAGADGRVRDGFVMSPQNRAFMWGNHDEVEIAPRAGLVEFMGKCRERGIGVGLSSWFQDDHLHRRDEVNTPQDYARTWSETLAFLDGEGLLDLVEWVDLCNEFPLETWAPGAYRYFRQASGKTFLPGLYGRKVKALLSDFINRSIAPVRERFPGLRCCFSLFVLDPENLGEVDLSNFGLLEPHLWLTMNYAFFILSGNWMTIALIPGTTRATYPASSFYYRAFRKGWLDWMGRMMDKWAKLAGRWRLPLFTSEAWGPVNYEDLPPPDDFREWKWVKDACEASMKMAAERGWRGICSSNFCGPQHPGMWQDLEWHRRVTAMIRG